MEIIVRFYLLYSVGLFDIHKTAKIINKQLKTTKN